MCAYFCFASDPDLFFDTIPMTRATCGALFLVSWLSLLVCDAAGLPAPEPERSVGHIVLQGPLKVLPTSPRYFVTPHGKPVYLNGSHTQLSLQDREGQPQLSFEFLLSFLQEHRHNFTKLWMQEDTIHIPLPYQRIGPALALDGKPKFDLTQLNPVYFDKLRSRAIDAENLGIYVGVMLFNGWSVESKEPNRHIWPRHPFNRANNVNNFDGDPNGDGEGAEVHTLSNPAITAIQEAYVRKVIDSINDLDNVLYEISNEGAATPENTTWQYHMIDFIHQYESTQPKQHPVGMTVQWPNGSNQVLYESPADWISPNSDEGHNINPPASNHGKVVLNDTDHLWGNGGNAVWVWKSFTRGLNPIFMDLTTPLSQQYTLPQADEIRVAMGDTLEYAKRIDLEKMEPRQDMCSTTFCLVSPGREYLVYFPPTGWCSIPLVGWFSKCKFTVDLSKVENTFTVEWFAPDTRERQYLGTATGGGVRTFIPPFRGPSVLYLKAQQT